VARRTRYLSDTSDEQWALIEPLLPEVKTGGRPEKHPRRALVDAILYVVRTGCAWRQLPADFPPFLWNQICQEPPGLPWRTSTMGSSVAVGGTPI
jgi:transposase